MTESIRIDTIKARNDARQMTSIDELVSAMVTDNQNVESALRACGGEAIEEALSMSDMLDAALRGYQAEFQGLITWIESAAQRFDEADEALAQAQTAIRA